METSIEMIATIEAIQILVAHVIGKTMKMAALHRKIEIIEVSMVQKIEIGKKQKKNRKMSFIQELYQVLRKKVFFLV